MAPDGTCERGRAGVLVRGQRSSTALCRDRRQGRQTRSQGAEEVADASGDGRLVTDRLLPSGGTMRAIAALMLITLAAAATHATAQMQQKLPRHEAKKEQGQPPLPRGDGYKERLADKLPFGSSAWWEQMKREGRLGGETP